MASFIDENKLRAKIQNEFKNNESEGMIRQEHFIRLNNIIIELDREAKIFTELPEPLVNLAYNILHTQIYNRIISKNTYYNEGFLISNIIDCVQHTDIVINTLMKVSEEFDNQDKKNAFYRLMGNNHMIIANYYGLRRDFFNYSINILYERMAISKLEDKITSEDAMVKLCELTVSGKYSRLQRAFDILMKHGDDLTINKNGIEYSNASRLGLRYDDIYSLYLLTRASKWSNIDFIYFLKDSIYNSIYAGNNEYSSNNPISDLYNAVYKMSIYNDFISDIKLYKNENIEKIKECLNELISEERQMFNINNEIQKSKLYCDISDINGFNTDNFKNNVIQKYLKSIESDILGINGHKNNSYIRTTILPIVIIFMIISMIILSIILLYPNEAKKIMNN